MAASLAPSLPPELAPEMQRRASESQLLNAEPQQAVSHTPTMADEDYGLAPAFDNLHLGGNGAATPMGPQDYYPPHPYAQHGQMAQQPQPPQYGQHPDMFGNFLPPQHGYPYYDTYPDMHGQYPRPNPANNHSFPHYPRPSTAQTQATHGSWGSPPMSPIMAPMGLATPYGHSRHGSMADEFGGPPAGRGGFFGSGSRPPPSAWSHSNMSSPFAFYTPFANHNPRLENVDWPAQSPHAPGLPFHGSVGSGSNRGRNRMSWSGPARAEPAPAVERKEYHPQPPARRSDWVMWVGNVPSNVSHEELWKFFNTTIPDAVDTEPTPWRGPSSIFLISRSSCAFVNFSSQADLDRAVPFFNGMALRPHDPRCPRMVCRIRRKDDDLRAGVGAQRGVGMHRAWVKELEIATPPPAAEPVHSPGVHSVPPSPAILEHPPEGEGRRRESVAGIDHHKSSASFASTDSSFLAKYFPKRYFILKSLTTIDLEESAAAGTWKTQRHNEPILDQAFRTSQEVILIFGANRSGEFFGYAKMIEPVNKERYEQRAAKATAKSASLGSSMSGSGSGPSKQWSTPERIREEESDTEDRSRAASDPARPPPRPNRFLSSSVAVPTSSPGQLTEEEEQRLAELHISPHAGGERHTDPPRPYQHHAAQVEPAKAKTIDVAAHGVELAAAQARLGHSDRPAVTDSDGVKRKDTVVAPERQDDGEPLLDAAGDSWGQPFRVQWLKVAPLPFQRTRHLRNPWNGDREVKVSRDGTEVEPGVGAALLAEWDKPEAAFNRSRPSLPTSPMANRFGIPTDVAYSALY
ncbi:hypothetical protein Q5752_004678 [Cryptotrichosporon argae]